MVYLIIRERCKFCACTIFPYNMYCFQPNNSNLTIFYFNRLRCTKMHKVPFNKNHLASTRLQRCCLMEVSVKKRFWTFFTWLETGLSRSPENNINWIFDSPSKTANRRVLTRKRITLYVETWIYGSVVRRLKISNSKVYPFLNKVL